MNKKDIDLIHTNTIVQKSNENVSSANKSRSVQKSPTGIGIETPTEPDLKAQVIDKYLQTPGTLDQ